MVAVWSRTRADELLSLPGVLCRCFISGLVGVQAIESVVLATEAEPQRPQPPVPAPKPHQPSADLLTPSTGESPLIDI